MSVIKLRTLRWEIILDYLGGANEAEIGAKRPGAKECKPLVEAEKDQGVDIPLRASGRNKGARPADTFALAQ